MKTVDKALDRDIDAITDCFTAADGGGSYIRFRALLADMAVQAAAGDAAAVQVVVIVRRFARLINATDMHGIPPAKRPHPR